ncbi:MAG: GerMN domain-containing protein [Micromonosporaceae bacterium]|nr:GerMN domain-containing protein [Micromonosporaceae bacterium]
MVAPVLAIALLHLAGCGVPVEDEPRQITPPRSQFAPHGSLTPEPADSGTVEEHLCFVRDAKLVVVVRRVAGYPVPSAHLRHLVSGPNEAERTTNLVNPLSDGNIAAEVRIDGTEAIVEFRAEVDTTVRTDEILMYGQIVCTLTTRPDTTGVSFYQEGQRLGIPRADGSLSQGPLTRIDYEELIVDG